MPLEGRFRQASSSRRPPLDWMGGTVRTDHHPWLEPTDCERCWGRMQACGLSARDGFGAANASSGPGGSERGGLRHKPASLWDLAWEGCRDQEARAVSSGTSMERGSWIRPQGGVPLCPLLCTPGTEHPAQTAQSSPEPGRHAGALGPSSHTHPALFLAPGLDQRCRQQAQEHRVAPATTFPAEASQDKLTRLSGPPSRPRFIAGLTGSARSRRLPMNLTLI